MRKSAGYWHEHGQLKLEWLSAALQRTCDGTELIRLFRAVHWAKGGRRGVERDQRSSTCSRASLQYSGCI